MSSRIIYSYLGALTPFFIWSGFGAKRIDLWFAEVLPIVIGSCILWWSHREFPLTRLSYAVIYIGALLMLVGSHYTYALVPLFDQLGEVFAWQRNHFDKLVHFCQGMIVVLLSREILLRQVRIASRAWCNVLAMICAAAVAAGWEVIEWIFVLLVRAQGVAEPVWGYLGQQNDAWDAQSDMFFAILGAGFALAVLRRYHDQQISRLWSAPVADGGH